MSARPDLDRLAVLAAAATPGPWRTKKASVFPTSEVLVVSNNVAGVPAIAATTCVLAHATEQNVDDATFIAACDPATLTWLVERVRELREALSGLMLANDHDDNCAAAACVRARAALSDTEQSRR